MPSSAPRRVWVFASLRGWRASWLAGDTVAALVLAAITIPEQLATARLVGVAPIYGLLTFAAGTAAFAAFGANRFMSVGADSTIAPIMAAALAAVATTGSPHYTALAALLAVMVGLILLSAGLFRGGWIADLLSEPVTTGFLAGIAVHITVGQLPVILGIPGTSGSELHRLLAIVGSLPEARLWPLLLGAGVLACALLADYVSPRIPGTLIGLVASGVVVWALALRGHGVAVMGALPVRLPTIAFTVPNWGDFGALFPGALIVALVCMMQTAAVLQSFPSDPEAPGDANRDFGALGLASVVAGCFGSFAANSSPPRTALVVESGGRSQLTGLIGIAIIAALVATTSAAFAYVPEAALGGVLVFIALRIVRVRTMYRIATEGGWEIWLVVASTALVVLMPIETGVTMSIVLSLLHSLYIIARPNCVELRRVSGTTVWWTSSDAEPGERVPGVLVFAPGAPINFTNATYVRNQLMAAIAAMPETCRLVVIEANGVIDVDYTGAQALKRTIAALRAQQIDVALARLEGQRAQRSAARTGLIAALAPDHVVRSVDEAVRRFSQHPI